MIWTPTRFDFPDSPVLTFPDFSMTLMLSWGSALLSLSRCSDVGTGLDLSLVDLSSLSPLYHSLGGLGFLAFLDILTLRFSHCLASWPELLLPLSSGIIGVYYDALLGKSLKDTILASKIGNDNISTKRRTLYFATGI